jgi:septal ring factor EnvC (AmiA/AmiB activator)
MDEQEKNSPAGGDEKAKTGPAKNFGRLRQFSGDLIKLGQEINSKLENKKVLEANIFEKGRELNKLRLEIFRLKEKLVKADLELSKLEKRRKDLEGGV